MKLPGYPGRTDLPVHFFEDYAQFQHFAEEHDGYAQTFGRGPWTPKDANAITAAVAQHAVSGFCVGCSSAVLFGFDLDAVRDAQQGREPDWREQAICPQCKLNARLRLAWHLYRMRFGTDDSVYATESITPFFRFLGSRVKRLEGSEYVPSLPFGTQVRLGAHIVNNQDLTRLAYADDAFDAIFCLEVLEHVPDYRAALSELKRTLRPDGQLILSVPFLLGEPHTRVRAELGEDGEITHHMEPEYHGDPVRGGVLCFYHFGWDLLDRMREAGFADVRLVYGRSDPFGYFGWGNILITATIKGME